MLGRAAWWAPPAGAAKGYWQGRFAALRLCGRLLLKLVRPRNGLGRMPQTPDRGRCPCTPARGQSRKGTKSPRATFSGHRGLSAPFSPVLWDSGVKPGFPAALHHSPNLLIRDIYGFQKPQRRVRLVIFLPLVLNIRPTSLTLIGNRPARLKGISSVSKCSSVSSSCLKYAASCHS